MSGLTVHTHPPSASCLALVEDLLRAVRASLFRVEEYHLTTKVLIDRASRCWPSRGLLSAGYKRNISGALFMKIDPADADTMPIPPRRKWSTPKVIMSEAAANTKGGYANPAVSGDVHFPSLGSTSNHS